MDVLTGGEILLGRIAYFQKAGGVCIKGRFSQPVLLDPALIRVFGLRAKQYWYYTVGKDGRVVPLVKLSQELAVEKIVAHSAAHENWKNALTLRGAVILSTVDESVSPMDEKLVVLVPTDAPWYQYLFVLPDGTGVAVNQKGSVDALYKRGARMSAWKVEQQLAHLEPSQNAETLRCPDWSIISTPIPPEKRGRHTIRVLFMLSRLREALKDTKFRVKDLAERAASWIGPSDKHQPTQVKLERRTQDAWPTLRVWYGSEVLKQVVGTEGANIGPFDYTLQFNHVHHQLNKSGLREEQRRAKLEQSEKTAQPEPSGL